MPEEYWSLDVTLKNQDKKSFQAKLSKKDKKKIEIKNKEEMDAILSELKEASYTVSSLKVMNRKKNEKLQFTSSLF